MNAIQKLKLDSLKKEKGRKDRDLEQKENPPRGKDVNIITAVSLEKIIERCFGNQQKQEKCFQDKNEQKQHALNAAQKYFFNEEKLAEQEQLNSNKKNKKEIDKSQLIATENNILECKSTQIQELKAYIQAKPVSWNLDQVKSSVILSKPKKLLNAITLQELRAISQGGRKDQINETTATYPSQQDNYSSEINVNPEGQSVSSSQTNDIPVIDCVKQILYPREQNDGENDDEDSDFERDWAKSFKQRQNQEQMQKKQLLQQNQGERFDIYDENLENDEEQLEEQQILKEIAKKAQQMLDPESLTIPLVKKGQSQNSQVSLTSVLSQLGMAENQKKLSKEKETKIVVPLDAEEISENEDEKVLKKKRKITEEKLRIANSELQKGEFFEREGYVLEWNNDGNNGNDSQCELEFSQPKVQELSVKDRLKKQTGKNKKSSAKDDISTKFKFNHSKRSQTQLNNSKTAQIVVNNNHKISKNSADQNDFQVSNMFSTLKSAPPCSSTAISSETKYKRLLRKGGEIFECIQPFSCIICLGQPNKIFGELKCFHRFCVSCIQNWAEVTNQCPQCRQSFSFIARKDFKGRPDRLNPLISVKNKTQKVSERNSREQARQIQEQEYQRNNRPCYQCNRNSHQNLLLICDVCNDQFCHTFCDERILSNMVPEGRWACHSCRP